jgi:hypothetical protein
LEALAGTNNLLEGGSRHQAVEIFVHEDYDPGNWYINDIAVVKVQEPFVFDSLTAPVPLPQQDQESAPGSTGTVVGWGLPYVSALPWKTLKPTAAFLIIKNNFRLEVASWMLFKKPIFRFTRTKNVIKSTVENLTQQISVLEFPEAAWDSAA